MIMREERRARAAISSYQGWWFWFSPFTFSNCWVNIVQTTYIIGNRIRLQGLGSLFTIYTQKGLILHIVTPWNERTLKDFERHILYFISHKYYLLKLKSLAIEVGATSNVQSRFEQHNLLCTIIDEKCEGEASSVMSDVVLDRLAEGSISGMEYEQWCLRLQRMKEVSGHLGMNKEFQF